jgi:iron complex outermembrane receptor protein
MIQVHRFNDSRTGDKPALRRPPGSAVLPLIAVLLFAPVAVAADFSGRVIDRTAAQVPGASVALQRGLLQFRSATDSSGAFRFANVEPGEYRLQIVHSGFQAVNRSVRIAEAPGPVLEIILEVANLIDSVVVTSEADGYKPESSTMGTKLDLPLLDTPQAIGIVGRALIEDRGLLRVAEAADNVSGVRASPGYGGLSSGNFYIRGFRSTFSGGNLRDGFRDYTFLSSRDVQGIERIEFLKGPSSILYGQAEVGGITNTVLKRPQPQRFATVGLQAGGYSLWRPTLDLNTPLNSAGTVLFRLNGAYEHAGSHRDQVQNESQYLSPALIWRIRPQTQLRIQAELQRYRYLFDTGYVPEPESLTLPRSNYYGEPGFNNSTTQQASLSIEFTHSFSDQWNYRGAVNALQSEGAMRYINPTGITANRRSLNRVAYITDEATQNYHLQNEVYGRFRTGRIQHNLAGGTELVRWAFPYIFNFGSTVPIDLYSPRYGSVPTGFFPLFGDRTWANISGTYIQDQIALRSNLKLLVGIRADFVDQRSSNPLTGLRTASRSVFNMAPRVGLLYNPWASASIYGSYTNSFLPQFGVTSDGKAFEPQRGKQVEAGWKQLLLGSRLFTTVTLYQIWKSNVPTPDPLNPRASILTGEQVSKGIELDLTGRLRSNWTITGNYSAIDAHVSRDNRLLVGSKLVGIPKHSVGLLSNYSIDRGRFTGVSFGGGIYANSRRQPTLPNRALFIPYYGRLDLYIAYRRAHWEIQANVKNLNDSLYYEAQGSQIVPQAGRNAILGMRYRF